MSISRLPVSPPVVEAGFVEIWRSRWSDHKPQLSEVAPTDILTCLPWMFCLVNSKGRSTCTRWWSQQAGICYHSWLLGSALMWQISKVQICKILPDTHLWDRSNFRGHRACTICRPTKKEMRHKSKYLRGTFASEKPWSLSFTDYMVKATLTQWYKIANIRLLWSTKIAT